jgi:Xaa-Pro aminopeptidase
MAAKTPNRGRNQDLAQSLRGAGSRLTPAAVRDLVRGVLAAPGSYDADAWMSLVVPRPNAGLRKALNQLLDEIAASLGAGPLDPCSRDERNRRLAALRAELRRRRLHGFIVPRGDEHQGEYVARRSERLAWLTGFTGSAGSAVVLKDRAAVFVDGRYTLQVRAEVDGDLYDFPETGTPADWAAANLPAEKARLGYDPWLHTPDQLAGLRAACKKADARLVAVDSNPVDAVWTGQPPPPITPVTAHAKAFAGRTAAEKRRQVVGILNAEKADAAVLTAPDSIAWLLNIRGADVPYTPLALAFAVIGGDGAVTLFIDRRKLTPGLERHLGKDVTVTKPEGFGPALDRLGKAGRTVRLNPAGAPAWVAARLQKAGAVISPGPDPCALPKARKNTVELDGLRAAHRRDGASLTRFLAWLARQQPGPGLTEMAAAERLEALRRDNEHFRGLSFPTISGAGANGAIVHYRVTAETDRALEPDSLYLLDSGAQYLDGTTDVTRTVAIGRPSDEMRGRFTRVLKGHIAVATARFPEGTSGSQLDPLARQALWQAGLDYDHGTGHGVGSYLGVHEGPQRIAKVPNKVALEPGMVVSNEPGYYKTGEFGIRIENLVTVVPLPAPMGAERPLLGFETLTLAPIDLNLVEPALLNAAEIWWLDHYHERVHKDLTPLVDTDTAAWLKRATQPMR